jgi:mono/diheme cytochrome c family protein
MVRILFGIVLGLALAPVALLAWFHFGHPPVAVADKPLPFEREITHVALNARIAAEALSAPAVQANEDTFVAGARIYGEQCAACHGFHGKPSSFGPHMYPNAPSLWQKHKNSEVVGVSDDPPGETFWKVDNGIRLTGMPSYHDVLSQTQIWQVTLLLANADKPLPPVAVAIVSGKEPPVTAPAVPAQHK